MKQPLSDKEYERFLKIEALIVEKEPVMVRLSDIAEALELNSEPAAKAVVDNLIRDRYLERWGRKKALRVVK